ncbi:hypothetical protein CGRA01v4_09245 [Colletotrichum graminicola]|nr:hypothetical protein CGRA01v4_09245 [Colletotrichum graminicola]
MEATVANDTRALTHVIHRLPRHLTMLDVLTMNTSTVASNSPPSIETPLVIVCPGDSLTRARQELEPWSHHADEPSKR